MSSTTLDVVHELGLPENAKYRDTGCSLHPSCLTCPFEKCRYDLDEEAIKALERSVHHGAALIMQQVAERRQRIRELRSQGLTATRVALELGITRRTVFRACS